MGVGSWGEGMHPRHQIPPFSSPSDPTCPLSSSPSPSGLRALTVPSRPVATETQTQVSSNLALNQKSISLISSALKLIRATQISLWLGIHHGGVNIVTAGE